MKRLSSFSHIVRLAASLLLTVLALSALACSGGSSTTTATATTGPTTAAIATPAATLTVDISEADAGFVPQSITVSPGQTVKFTFTNKGQALHNLRIAGSNGQYEGPGNAVTNPLFVQPGQSGTIEWKAPSQPSTVNFRCDYHPEHTGTITVR